MNASAVIMAIGVSTGLNESLIKALNKINSEIVRIILLVKVGIMLDNVAVALQNML